MSRDRMLSWQYKRITDTLSSSGLTVVNDKADHSIVVRRIFGSAEIATGNISVTQGTGLPGAALTDIAVIKPSDNIDLPGLRIGLPEGRKLNLISDGSGDIDITVEFAYVRTNMIGRKDIGV